MDLLEKAHELGVDKWTVADFVLGVESLRQQLAVLQINNTKFLDISVENEQLKQQLAECEREREKQIKACNEFWGKKSDADYGEIQRLSSALNVLREFDNPYQVGDVWQWTGPAPEDIDAALAKLGADKTGEK